jgi:cytochrome c-type biogenesis protein CcmE
MSGRVTSCTSCHSDSTGGGGFTLELVEATARLDLMHWHKKRAEEAGCCAPPLEASVKAGRFVVPFGAFAAMSHPGVYRTVTNPLMYIMGRTVNVAPPRRPVLPMPYADEGIDLETRLDICCDIAATLDVYAVNGLQASGPGISFFSSRSYADNNSQPAIGGRATVGNRRMRIGGSVMSGQMQRDVTSPDLNYHFAGGDVVVRYEDIVRVYYEYAIRRNDSPFGRGEIVYGNVFEGELLLLSHPKISLLARYDNLAHHDFAGELEIERFTWGINTVLPGGSFLSVNHERWNFPRPEPDVDVIGLRWVATF